MLKNKDIPRENRRSEGSKTIVISISQWKATSAPISMRMTMTSTSAIKENPNVTSEDRTLEMGKMLTEILFFCNRLRWLTRHGSEPDVEARITLKIIFPLKT